MFVFDPSTHEGNGRYATCMRRRARAKGKALPAIGTSFDNPHRSKSFGTLARHGFTSLENGHCLAAMPVRAVHAPIRAGAVGRTLAKEHGVA
jgi:hypothetical protein